MVRFLSTEEDDENAYRTEEDMAGRSFRRGVDKGLNAVANMLTLGLWSALTSDNSSEASINSSDALTDLSQDAADEYINKVIPRSEESEDS